MNQDILNSQTENIISAYEKYWLHLPLDKAGHFFERAYKITGKLEHEKIIAIHIAINKFNQLKKKLSHLKNNNYSKIPLRPFTGTLNERRKRRQKLYKHRPEIQFFDELSIDLLFLSNFSLHESFLKKEFSEITELLKKIDFENVYLRDEVIRFDSSFAFNTLFILKNLGVVNLTDKAEGRLRELYVDNEKYKLRSAMADWEFCSLIYSMTHIIIADSKFYERTSPEHEWILNFFSSNIEIILQRVTTDILTEVALSIKLCHKIKSFDSIFRKLIDHIMTKVQLEKLNEIDYVIYEEHTMSILMLLLSEKKDFFHGPDLSKNEILQTILC